MIRLRSRFIARADLISAIEREFDDVLTGRPRMVVVTGDAGHGKTRLIREVGDRLSRTATVVTTRGEATGAAGLAPVQRLFEALARQRDRVLSTRGGQVHVPTRTDLLGQGDLRTESELRSTIANDILEMVGDDPHVLMIEDLHWCDAATIRLLELLCTELADSTVFVPVLVIVTTRTFPSYPAVDAFLARSRSVIEPLELHLAPFDEHEIEELVRSYNVTRPSRALIHLLTSAARGSPFAVNEALYALLRFGALIVDDSAGVGALREQPPFPELQLFASADHLVEKRIADLPRPTRRMVDILSVLGGRADVASFADAADIPHDIGEVALQDAVESGVLSIDDGVVRFAHDLLADGVARLLGRQRHLLRVELLHRLAEQPEPDIDAIALLVCAVPDLKPTASMLDALVEAGCRAAGRAAWDEAIDLLRRFLADESDRTNFGERRVLEARMVLARCLDRGLRDGEAEDEYRRVATDALGLGDLDTWAAAEGEIIARAAVHGERPDPAAAEPLLALLPDHRRDLRASLLAKQSIALATAGDLEQALEVGNRAIELADGTMNQRIRTEVLDTLGMSEFALLRTGAARARFEEILDVREGEIDPTRRAWAHCRLSLISWVGGALDEADEHAQTALRMFSQNRHRFGESLVVAMQSGLAALCGDLDTAFERGERATWLNQISGHHFAPMVLFPAMTCAGVLRGDSAATEQFAQRWATSRGPGSGFARELVEAWSGATPVLNERLRARLHRSLARRPDRIVAHAELGFAVDLLAALESPDEFAVALTEALDGLTATSAQVMFNPLSPFSTSRIIGRGELALGEWGDAVGALTEATTLCTERSAISELLRARLDLARADPTKDVEHRAAAATHASQIGSRIGAPVASSEAMLGTAAQELVVLVTDLVGSTGVSVRDGDEAYLALVESHHRAVRRALLANGGHEFSTSGDGIYAWFAEPMAAARCAADIQRAFRGDMADPAHPSLANAAVKVALVCGRPIVRRGHVYGAAVNLAARLVSLARPGQVLSNELLKIRIKSDGSRLLGRYALKGFDEPVPVFALPIGDSTNRLD